MDVNANLKDTFYARLSGVHPTLPLSELKAVAEAEEIKLEIIATIDLITLFRISGSITSLQKRLAYTKAIGILLGVSEVEDAKDFIEEWSCKVKSLNIESVSIAFERLRGVSRSLIHGEEVISYTLSMLRKCGVRVDPKSKVKLDLIVAEGVVISGLRLFTLNVKDFEKRRPRKRPFFKPGPLDPRLSRVLVNLSRLKKGQTFLDPFCGTGGIALEACLMGASKVVCGDIDREMSVGSHMNLSYYRCSPFSMSYLGDAMVPPIRLESIEAIATDPPYGRSTTTRGRDLEKLYKGFTESLLSIAKKGSYIVFAGPAWLKPEKVAKDYGLKVVEYHNMYVHSSLVRTIVVARA